MLILDINIQGGISSKYHSLFSICVLMFYSGKLLSSRIAQVYIFYWICLFVYVHSSHYKEQIRANLLKHSSGCLQICLSELGIHCDLGPCWEPLVPIGAWESCTLQRTKQINNWLQGTPLDALLKHMCCNKDNIPKVQCARWLQICSHQQASSN